MDCHRSAYLDAKLGQKVSLVSQRGILEGILCYSDGYYWMQPCTHIYEDGRKHVTGGKFLFRKSFIKASRWKPV